MVVYLGFVLHFLTYMCFVGKELGCLYSFVVCLYGFGDHCGDSMYFITFDN